jgi:enoyl-CoA hydratase
MNSESDRNVPLSQPPAREPVLVTTDTGEGVLLIELNRPAQRNALNAELRNAIRSAIDAFDDDPKYRCAVLGARGPSF